MLFNSYEFILAFLPLAVLGYFLLCKVNNKAAQVFLLCMSLFFYAYDVPGYLAIIISSIVINYCFTRAFSSKLSDPFKKILFVLGIIFNVGILFYYKYFNFFMNNANKFLQTDFEIKKIMLPLGISFYTIQQLSFLVDSYKDRTIKYGFLEYALYVSLFPQLVAGPIVYHSELISQFRDKENLKVNAENVMSGLLWFICGLGKKIFIADSFGRAVDYGFSNIYGLSTPDAWVTMLAFTLQIYFDFSGYSDMACGIAKMFNFELPQNFNSPYKALSVRDFWRRWHMTLTRFLTKYIYLPLGGNRKGTARTALNILIVFLVSGIWHGANYTFFLWGLLYGIIMVLDRFTGDLYDKLPKVFRWVMTFFVVNVLWVLFRAGGVIDWIVIIKRLFVSDSYVLSPELMTSFDTYIPVWIQLAGALALCVIPKNNYVKKIKVNYATVAAGALLLGLCLLTLNKISIFLYFNF